MCISTCACTCMYMHIFFCKCIFMHSSHTLIVHGVYNVCVCMCVCVFVYVRVRVWHLCMGMSCRNREFQTQLPLLLRKKTKESELIVKSITILVHVLHRHRSNERGAQGARRSQRKRSVFKMYMSAFTFARTTSSTRRNMRRRAGNTANIT